MKKQHVIIVGGGFAGLSCAKALADNPNIKITLIDRNTYQQFQPLLYQVGCGYLSAGSASFNLRTVLRKHHNISIKAAEVTTVDLSTKTVGTSEQLRFQGDILVLAAGSQPNFYGIPGAEEFCFPLYSVSNAERLYAKLQSVVEAVDLNPLLLDEGALNFVVVGTGPTGVETAGALADGMRSILANLYKDFDTSRAQVFLVNRSTEILGAFSEKSQQYAARLLKKQGVQLVLGSAVKEVTKGSVTLDDGTTIPTHTVIWAGGLQASQLAGNLVEISGKGGRIDVGNDLRVQGFENIYALGDFANILGKDGKPLPQLASVAQQAGRHCAENIKAGIVGQTVKPFDYLDKGIMAMIARNAAVAEIGTKPLVLTGWIAFVAWLGVHVLLLTTARAKFTTLMEWCWDYITWA
jgi:NADH dehydrogenase